MLFETLGLWFEGLDVLVESSSNIGVGGEAAKGALRRKQGVLMSYAYTAGQVVVNLLYVPLLLSTIGRDEYGLYQLVGSIMTYIVSINSVLSAGVSRYYSMYKAEGNGRMMESTLAIARRLYWGLSVIAVAIVFVLIPAFRAVYADSFTTAQVDECSVMLAVLAVNTVVTFNNTINIAAITANERFVFLKGTQLATLVAQPLLIILMAQHFPSAVTICLVVLAMNVLCATLQRIFAQGFLEVKYTFHGWDRRLVRGLLGFSVAVVMVTVADQVFWSSGQLVVGYFSGAAAVAVYAVGAQVYKAYTYAGTAVSGVFFQRVSELWHRDRDMPAISALFAKAGRVNFLVCSLILGGFAVLGQDFMGIWAGEGYEDAYWIALAVMVPLTVDLCQNLGLTIMQVLDKYYFRGVVYLVLAVVNFGASVAVASTLGPVAVAVSSGTCMLIGNGLVMNWYYAKRIGLDIVLFWREIGGLAAPFAVVVAIAGTLYRLFPVGHGGMPLFIAGGCAYLLLYALIVGKWGLNGYERGQVKAIVSRLPHFGRSANE